MLVALRGETINKTYVENISAKNIFHFYEQISSADWSLTLSNDSAEMLLCAICKTWAMKELLKIIKARKKLYGICFFA